MGLYRIRANFFVWGTMRHIFIDKYLGGVRSAVALILIFGLEVWRCVLFAGFLFGRWKLGEGVVLLRFLWCWFRAFFLKRFIR